MAEATSDPWRMIAPAEAVEASLGTTYLRADECRWEASLPLEITELLAGPLLVGAAPAGTPVGRHAVR